MDGFPRLISGGFAATATLADLDQDGDIEVMVGTDDYLFHVWDLPGTYDPETIDWAMYRHDPQCSGLALRAPKLSPLEIPSVIGVGNTLQLELGASNPDNLTLSFYVRQMPTGASFDDETRIFTWTPTPDQVDQVFDFYLFVTDGIRQDHRPVSITVMCTEAPVPTASGWGMIVMALLTLTAGTVVYSRPRLPDFASRQ